MGGRARPTVGVAPVETSALLWIMVSRERLVRLASRGTELANARRVRLVAHVLLLGGIVFILVRLRSILQDRNVHLTSGGWGWLAGATVLGVAAVIGSSLIWLVILRRLGLVVRLRIAAIYLQAQLGKYIPGSVWQYASRGTMARAQGLPIRTVAKSLPIELAGTLCAGAAFAFFTLGWWGTFAVLGALGIAAGLGTYLNHDRVAIRVTAQTVPLYAVTWPLIGVSFWMTARAFLHVAPSDLALYAGAFAVAWMVGLVAIYAPGGIGVREAVLVALLHHRIGSADALVVAAASRAVFTFADLISAGLSLPLLRRQPHHAAEPAPPA
jgi:uncharacterized membrane protein YbhN (UPF0104 family)